VDRAFHRTKLILAPETHHPSIERGALDPPRENSMRVVQTTRMSVQLPLDHLSELWPKKFDT
jgi:hypothetical protein